VGFEPTISAGERPQTYALDRAATGTGTTATVTAAAANYYLLLLLLSLLYSVLYYECAGTDIRPMREIAQKHSKNDLTIAVAQP